MPPLDRTHFVPVTRPASDLSGTQAIRGWVSFPASGGVQVVDANGVVTTIAGSSGGAGALLAATQTFTGRNTFAPDAATAVAILTPSFSLDFAAMQTLAAGTEADIQAAIRVTAPDYAGTAPGTTVDAVATLYVEGPPTVGDGLTATNGAYAILALNGRSAFGALEADAIEVFGGISAELDITLQQTELTSLTLTGTPTGLRTATFPDASGTVALLERAQTFTGVQTFGNASTVFSGASPVLSASAVNTGLALRGAGTGVTSLQGSGGAIVGVSTNGGPRLGFFSVAAAPIAQPTGVAADATAIRDALVALGLITA